MKPAKEGAATNLNLVTAGGEVYSFLLTEKNGTSMPDLKVYVPSEPNAPKGKPKYYSAAQVEGLKAAIEEARAGVEAANRRATESKATFQQQYPAKLQFSYGSPRYQKPFLVRSICNDGQFTYIKSDATELPALHATATRPCFCFMILGNHSIYAKSESAGIFADHRWD